MASRRISLAALACLALAAQPGTAAIVCSDGPRTQWTPAGGGNGHFYQAFCTHRTWADANAAAVALGGHLATLTTSGENAFVFSLINDQSFWSLAVTNYGPWIGGLQPPGSPEPAGGWEWATGEAFSFTAWYSAEPNNIGGEDRIGFYDGTGGAVRSAQWADFQPSFMAPYVVEWEHSLDVDLDGEVAPLTDGILILRYLFGFTGVTLTAGAVDTVNCKRCDADSIKAFLDLQFTGVVYDATADWSDAANPNGPWSYLEGANALPHIASWQSSLGGYTSPQPGWARSENGTNRIPFFHRSLGFENFVHDYQAGDLVVHTWDPTNGVGNSNGRLRFTVPATGIYHTTLAIWIGREIGRSVNWELDLNDASQASGTVASGDGFSRSSPDGTKKSLSLAAGDHVDLKLDTASVSGDFVGLRLRLEAFGLDIDGDGEAQPLTDGLLILRYLFGFTESALTTGTVDLTNCTRCDATAITAYENAFE